MKIHTNTGGLVATNGYLLADEPSGAAAIIDAPHQTLEPLLKIAQHHGYDIRHLLLTHGHWDHLGDHEVLTRAYPRAQVLIHRLGEAKLLSPGSSIFTLPYVIASRKADGYLEDAQRIDIGAIELEVIHTPGHAPGHVVFYAAAEGVLLAGDLLFAKSIGRTDLPDSDAAVMHRSLVRVMRLPDAVRVLPGHGPPTTIGQERRDNPWLREAEFHANEK